MPGVVLLILYAVCAVIIVRLAARRVVPLLASGPQRAAEQLLCDVALPLSLAIPVAVAGIDVSAADASLASRGFVFSWPVAMAGLGLGIAFVAHRRGGEVSLATAQILILPATGLTMLLLSIFGTLTVGVGQTAFAAAMVLIWCNLPGVPKRKRGEHPEGDERPSDERSNRGRIVLALITLALVQGVIIFLLDPQKQRIAAAISAVEAAIVFSAFAASPGRINYAVRISQWCGAYGMLLAVGLLSFVTVMAATLRITFSDEHEPMLAILHGVAEGFEHIAIDGVILAALPMILLAGIFAARLWRIIVGAALIVAAAGFLAWRLV